MPQMMPMNWLLLNILFNITFFIFMIMIYFNFKKNMTLNSNFKIKNDSKFILNFWPLN
uniref:ATP synthase F0 subunit 8 n=1 Tax=Uenoa lobata TaxID=1958741 RepID=UPI0022DCE06A|nr:ATP synthase F0 subunit 8 [Uenoa lobata]UZZ44445.1 ATP synthase F0 subunit 8 [Uenoa lobata]